MSKVVVVTGASSGIGLAIAQNFESLGYTVYSFSRNAPSDENIHFIPCDVSDFESVLHAFSSLIDKEGEIDILVNNAGMGISGAIEYAPQQDIKRIVDVNLLGVVNCCQVALPYLRESKGIILNISSLGAEFTIAFQAMYSATKSAVLAFSTALRNEVRPCGVRVSCLLPGDVKTDFTKNRIKKETPETVYSQREKRSVAYMEKCEQSGMPASKIAKKVVKICNKKHPPVSFTVGVQYKLARFAYRILPQKLVNKILYSMYGK